MKRNFIRNLDCDLYDVVYECMNINYHEREYLSLFNQMYGNGLISKML